MLESSVSAGMTRRRLLRLATGGFVAALGGEAATYLSGCGSADRTIQIPTAGPVSRFGLPFTGTLERPVASGTLLQQFDQHAASVNNILFAMSLPVASLAPPAQALELIGPAAVTRQTSADALNPAQKIGRLMNANIAFTKEMVQRAMTALV
jgi:hypothetical protein